MRVLLVVLLLLAIPESILLALRFGLIPYALTLRTLEIGAAAGAAIGVGAYIGFLSSSPGEAASRPAMFSATTSS